jgi:uroporphyrinogen decarboxylase
MRSLAGEATARRPVWLMRQAGRYLPEYREIRARAKSFLEFCYTPELTIEATLQPIRRFGFDASILFSDILVVPDALGQRVWFVEGEGPKLEPIADMGGFSLLPGAIDLERLAPVFETVRGLVAGLPADVPLIGFCGAPYTVASYMLGGGSGRQHVIQRLAYTDPAVVGAVIDRVTEASVAYLRAQIDAGVDAVQIFESWGAQAPPAQVEAMLIAPLRRIVESLRASHPGTPILAFPRTAASAPVRATAALGVEAVSIETTLDLAEARTCVGPRQALQGNLDPMLMVVGGEMLDRAVDDALAAMEGRPYIVNLGHGITPDGSIAAVERLLRRVRS